MNKEIIVFFKRIIRKVFPWVINIKARIHGNRIIKLSPLPFREYCEAAGDKYTVVEKSQDRMVYEPAYYNKSEGQEHFFHSHEIYIAELTDVCAHGGTGIIISKGNALTDLCVNDPENRVNYTSGGIRRSSRNAFFLEAAQEIDEIDEAVSMCGLAASNYYHLTFEILSRYGYVKEYLGDRRVPVLLDEDAGKYPQFVDLVKTVLGDVQIKYVPLYKRVHCKKLIYPSMNIWMPMNVRKKNDFRLSDNLIAYSAIENIRNAARPLMKQQSDLKIFVSRKNTETSRVANEKELVELFKQAGYKIVCTEELSYGEQVELFSSASVIVGASGAALANLVYCQEGTAFGCIIPQKYNFCIYSSIARMVGCKELYLDAVVSHRGRTLSTEQYDVDESECVDFINSIGNLL